MRRLLLVSLAGVVLLALAGFLFVRARLGSDLVRAAIEQQLSARLRQPVRIGSATATLFPRVAVELHDVAIGEPAAIDIDRLRIVTGLRGLLARRVVDAEAMVEGGRLVMPLPFSLASNGSPADASASGGTFSVESVHSIGMRNLTLVAGDASVAVDLDSSLAQDRLDIRTLTLRAATSRIAASGSLDLTTLEGSFDASADPLDLDEIVTLASAMSGSATEGTTAGGGEASPARIVLKLSAPSATFSTISFTSLATVLDLTAGHVTLSPLGVQAFGGRFDGRLEADTSGAQPQLRLNGKIEGLDVAPLLDASQSAGGITGSLGGTVALTGSGSDPQALINSARGTIDAAVTDGRIPGLDLVRTIVLAFGKPTGAPPVGSGAAFSRLGGRFAVAAGTLTSRDLAMTSRDCDLAGQGSLHLQSGRVDADVSVVLSKELTAQAGTDFRRYAQQDGRIVVPATIGGTLEHPMVSPDLVSAAKRAIGNELQRRARSLLEGLLKKKE
jgi:uncharacterized protein involved in outer membrane biogenesis